MRSMKVVVGGLVVVVVGLAAFGGYKLFSGNDNVPPVVRAGAGGVGTGRLICDDGMVVPRDQPGVAAKLVVNGKEDPYRWVVRGHGVAYEMYYDGRTGRTWAFGKNGQVTSPFPAPKK